MNQTRVFRLDARAQADGLIDVSLASAYPVDRGGFIEILDMSAEAIDLSRAVDGLPFLSDHGQTRLGRVRSLRTDGKRLRGVLKFFDTPAGQEARAEVDGGHREVSIGYEILRTEKRGSELHVRRWRPYEASQVAVPADPTVGIQRSLSTGTTMNTNDQNDQHGDGAEQQQLSRNQRRQARQGDDIERERVRSITATAKAYKQWVGADHIERAINDGWTTERFNEEIMTRMQSGATDVTSSVFGIIKQRGDPQDYSARYSLARAIQAQVDPATYMRHAGFEAEISQELQRSSPLQSPGILIPAGAFFAQSGRRDMVAGTSNLGGSTIETAVPGAQWIDALRARSVIMSLGATTLPLEQPVNIPKKTATSTTGWVTETGGVPETDVNTGSVALAPKRVGAYTEPSRQLLLTSSIAIENMLRGDLATSLMAELDLVGMLGTGASNQPRGVYNTSGIGSVAGGTNGAALTWAHILELEKSVDDANGMVNLGTVGYAINGSTRSYLKRTPKHATLSEGLIMGETPNDADGLNRLNSYRAAVSSKLPKNLVKGSSGTTCSLLLFGDWSQLIVAIFGNGVEIIVDPYSLAVTGQVRITANLFADVGVRQVASFAAMADALLP